MNVTQRDIGVNFRDGVARIRVWAPHSERVSLVYTNGSLSLEPLKLGYWGLETTALQPGESYQFKLDGKLLPDPAALSQPDVHLASVALDLGYSWQDETWKNHQLKDYIIYELHAGTFTPEGTFQAAGDKLDHLIELGITAIELMPVAQFPGERNWGYDGVFHFAVQASYGGAKALQELVDRCHQKGIAVILDVVYNHLGPEGNYLGEYGPYFTQKYQTPWGNALNFDDAHCDPVRSYFIENALMWFRDFHIDALRLDAVHAIRDFSPKHILQEIGEYTNELNTRLGKDHYLVIECDLNDPKFINPADRCGYSMDAQWTDEFHHALRVAAGGKKEGYYADFDGLASLARAYQHGYVYCGQYSRHRQKYFGVDPAGNPGQQFVVFSQNHDQVGNRMLGERSSQLFSFEMQKLLAAAVLVSPFLPMLFMGEEFGSTSPFQYFVSHTDPELIAAVRKGRREEFAAFHAEGEAPDPQDPQTFESSKLHWQEIHDQKNATLFNYYKELIRLRKSYPDLQANGRGQLTVEVNEAAQTLQLKRSDILCALDFKNENILIRDASGKILLNSASAEWGGNDV